MTGVPFMGQVSHKWRERAPRPLPWSDSTYFAYSTNSRVSPLGPVKKTFFMPEGDIRRWIWYCLRQDKPGSLAKLGKVYSFFGNFRCYIGSPSRAGMWKSLWKSASKTRMPGLKADTLADRFRTAGRLRLVFHFRRHTPLDWVLPSARQAR